MCYCIECYADLSELIGFDNLCDDYIECPECQHKMAITYDESFDGEEETQIWGVENYKPE